MTPTDFLERCAVLLKQRPELEPKAGELRLQPNRSGGLAWFGIAPDGFKFNPYQSIAFLTAYFAEIAANKCVSILGRNDGTYAVVRHLPTGMVSIDTLPCYLSALLAAVEETTS